MSSIRSRISAIVNVSINSMTSSMCRAVSLARALMYSSSISLYSSSIYSGVSVCMHVYSVCRVSIYSSSVNVHMMYSVYSVLYKYIVYVCIINIEI